MDELPDTPVGWQLAWVFDRLLTGRADDAEIGDHFEHDFLAQVPAPSLRKTAETVLGSPAPLTISAVTAIGEHNALADVRSAHGPAAVMASVALDPPHRITALLFRPTEAEPDERTTSCNVIVLNGTSSSGKSTLAKALQVELDGVWLHVEIDAFLRMVPPKSLGDDEVITRSAHAAVAAMAAEGSNLIVDHVLLDSTRTKDFQLRMLDHRVFWVGVHCDPEVLDDREGRRGDRMVGQARRQLATIHADKAYDVEVDTTATSAEECARRIIAALPPR